MIKIQKEDFNLESEIQTIKNSYPSVGAITTFVGYVRDYNNNKKVQFIELDVYKKMAEKELGRIKKKAENKWKLVDTLIIHRYGKLKVNEKIVMVCCLSEHRQDSFESCNFIMNYLKQNAPFWKNEFYIKSNKWLVNSD